MSSGDSKNQRRERAGIVLEVRYHNAGQFLVSYCTNLSQGGLFVSTATPLPLGTEITLEIRVPGRSLPANIMAAVRWIRLQSDSEGPAGMGLQFEDIDAVLGQHIDRLVTHAAPLRIDLLSSVGRSSNHLDALLRSLLSCETRQFELDDRVSLQIGRSDLLVVDLKGAPEVAIALLREISNRERPPPILALCSANDPGLHDRAVQYARVVSTPVDSGELRTRVLETLCEVSLAGLRGI